VTRPVPHDSRPPVAIIPRALLGSSLAILAVAGILNAQGQTAGGPEALSWLAVGWAALAPLAAVSVRGEGLVAPPTRPGASPEQATALARGTIVFHALLESAVVLAAVAAMVSPPWWPLAAAALPVAVMALNLPSPAG
jgi:hypothetical protein